MHRAIISDLDGTLLNSQHQISDFTRTTLRTLVEGGVRFVVATGRHVIDVRGIRDSLGFDCDLITANGALVSDADDTERFSHTLAPDVVAQLLALTQADTRFDTNVFTRDGWYANRVKPEWQAFHTESGFACTVRDLREVPADRINKLFLLGDHAPLAELEYRLRQACGDAASITFSLPECLEIMAADVNKGNAAREVLDRHGLGLADAVAFGDGMNDFELLSMVSRGFVMGNASARLKAALPGHARVDSCDEDGVARTLVALYGL